MQQSCRNFVQGFYDWYVPTAVKESSVPASDLALKYKSHLFDVELLRLLREDSAAANKTPGEIAGLDFDPFLNSQDPDERYITGKVSDKEERCEAAIYGISSGKKRDEVAVVAVLRYKEGNWFFVNFKYSGNQDLLSVLKNLRKARRSAKD